MCYKKSAIPSGFQLARLSKDQKFKFLPDSDDEPIVILLLQRFFSDPMITVEERDAIGLHGGNLRAQYI
jgi:hypothetical protein